MYSSLAGSVTLNIFTKSSNSNFTKYFPALALGIHLPRVGFLGSVDVSGSI